MLFEEDWWIPSARKMNLEAARLIKVARFAKFTSSWFIQTFWSSKPNEIQHIIFPFVNNTGRTCSCRWTKMDLISIEIVEQVRAEISKINSVHDDSIDPYPARIIARGKCIRVGWGNFHNHSIPSIYFVVAASDQIKQELNLLGLRGVVEMSWPAQPPSFLHNCTE